MITLFSYSKEGGFQSLDEADTLPALLADKNRVIWLDLEKASSSESELLTSCFSFHPLAIEDCISETLLPKIDDFGNYIFLVLHGSRELADQTFTTVEINFFLGQNYLVTYHDEPSRSINRTRERCLKKGPAMTLGVDFLLHDILDGMVDHYFPVLDRFDETAERIEEAVFANPDSKILNKIFDLKKEVMALRRVTGPQREILNRLSRDSFSVISPKAAIYFRDVYDHLVRISDLVESYRDRVSGDLDAYLSVVSNRLNQIMKILTIFTATMMPLTLITGIYGMNFDNMPELKSPHGYYVVLGVMLVVMTSMILFFKRKKWL